MTQDRDIERVLEHWFADGVIEMPDRVYQSIFDRVEHQPQRLAPRLVRRLPKMNGSLRWIAAAAAVLLIAVAGFAVLGRTSESGVGGAPVSPSPSPPTSVAPSPSASPAWDAPDAGPCGQRGCGGPLTAGTYTSTGLQPPVTYALAKPWVNVRDWPEFFMLYPDTVANRALAAHGNSAPYVLILPGPTTVSPSAACPDESAPDAVEVDAAGFVEFLAGRDHLSVTEPVAVTVGGLSGQQVDVGIEPGWTGCLPGTPADVPPAQTDSFRYILLDKPGGESLMISLWTPTSFEAFMADAMPVVESFEFDLGARASPS